MNWSLMLVENFATVANRGGTYGPGTARSNGTTRDYSHRTVGSNMSQDDKVHCDPWVQWDHWVSKDTRSNDMNGFNDNDTDWYN